jgi:hypothetical protein
VVLLPEAGLLPQLHDGAADDEVRDSVTPPMARR